MALTRSRRAMRLVLAVVGRRGEGATVGGVDVTVASRALSLVAIMVAAAGDAADEGQPLAHPAELVELARRAPWAWRWPDVRAEWFALCSEAEEAHDGDAWRRLVGDVRASGELELARLWGVSVAGAGTEVG